jgi:DNA-binding LacI/PurR family transcriptional regulator
MNRRRVSIDDIALAAGVANSTVSRALRDSPLISAEVRARIQLLAREMGYTPNGIAQSLQTRRTDSIGLVVTSIADPFFSDVVKGVEAVARPAGLSLFLSASHNDPAQEAAVIETFHRRRVDGILVASSRLSGRSAEHLARVDVPLVWLNTNAEGQPGQLHSVAVDDHLGARLAVEHLLGLGHRAIGYIGAENRPKANRRRLEGYRDALAATGVTASDSWVAVAPADDPHLPDDVAAGRELTTALLEAGVTALFCFNDLIATGALLACRERGVTVPEQLSVVGFDDIELTRYLTPPLTTVHQPKIELGSTAMGLMLDLLRGRPGRDHLLTPVLMTRGSTAPPRG